MSMTNASFNEKITAVFSIIERDHIKGKGLRGIFLTGEFLKRIDQSGLQLLKSTLPDDVAIVVYDQSPLNFIINFSSPPRDQFYVIFCSSTWDKVSEGGMIPTIEAIFKQERGKLTCEIHDVASIYDLKPSLKTISLLPRFETLIDTILNPASSSSSVMALALSIKEDLNK
jgi:hypothetical protein